VSNERVRRGLGRFSLAVYSILALVFMWVCVHYDGLRQDLWLRTTTGSTREQVLVEFYQLRTEYFVITGALIALGVIWFLIVKREKKRHPERYFRYMQR